MILSRFRLWLKQQLVGGFSLVELMVTITLMAIVGAGVVSVMDYVQSTRVRVQTTVELNDEVDRAELFVRTRLKTADRLLFDNSSVNWSDMLYSAECLLLLRRDPQDRTGVNLVQNSAEVTTANFPQLGDNQAFTLGLWFKRDNKSMPTIETLASWGTYDPNGESSIAFVLTPFGELAIRYGNKTLFVPAPRNLHNGKWHHLVVSYDNITSSGMADANSVNVFLNGYPRAVNAVDPNITPMIDLGPSADDFSIGVPLTGDNFTAFNGVISDVEFYDSAANEVQASAIYDINLDPNGMMKQLHWPLSSYDADNDRFADISGKNRTGAAIGLSDATATATTTNERYFGDVFAMVDRPNDGNDNYELLHRARHDDCPDSIAEANGFKTVSDDIFVRPENGNFFTRSDSDANDVLFNYGYRAGNGAASFNYDTSPKKLALNKKFFDEDFCRADPNLVLNRPAGVASCPITQGFAYIATDYDNETDELFIPKAQFWADNSTYYNIPGAPNTINATWSADTGVMSFFVTDGSAVEIEEWEKTMRNLAYRPKREEYAPTKDIVISLGYLPMEINGQFHFYDFIEVADGVTVDWEASQNAAFASTFCGTKGYLATVTSRAENDFLIERFRKSNGAVPAGWLGGTDKATNGQWLWEANSPEAGTRFWDQTNVSTADGRPVSSLGLDVMDGDFTMTDDVAIVGAPADAFKRRVTTQDNPAVTLHYHNWASYEPNDVGSGNGEAYLQIVGSPIGQGLWNDLPDNRPCIDNQKYDPCGYYVEFGGRPGESLNSLVYERTVDLSAQREFCKQE